MNNTHSPSFLRPRRCAGVGIAISALALAGCGSGGAGDPNNRGPFSVRSVTTGLGQVYPHRIRQVGANGTATTAVVNIDSIDVLRRNQTPTNPVLPVAAFGTTATLPDGRAGNQYLAISFSHALDEQSVLSTQLAAQTSAGLTTAIALTTYDEDTERTEPLAGRAFVGGKTVVQRGGGLELVTAVVDRGGRLEVVDPVANGFPSGFPGDTALVAPSAFVFVADKDGDLATLETFPRDRLLRIGVSAAVRDLHGAPLTHEVQTATTVGPDPHPADVLGVSAGRPPSIQPGNGETGVDPATEIVIQFDKPVRPSSVGALFVTGNPTPPAGGVTLAAETGGKRYTVPYHADPVSFGDFTRYALRPAWPLEGDTKITVTVNAATVRSLHGMALGADATTDFTTGAGPDLVNAPVAPEALYIGLSGSNPGVSVMDLNGFGQGTGDPAKSRFSLNPNLGQPVFPPLQPGSSAIDGGGAGVFTLTESARGQTRLVRDPLLVHVGDIQIGQPLDLVFNNENINRNASGALQDNPIVGVNQPGNTISLAPHPNPPRLVFPPPNPARGIFTDEPTVTSTQGPPGRIVLASPPCFASPVNLLGKGNPNANTPGQIGVFGGAVLGVFAGPQPPPASPPPPTPFCPYSSRQQVGHFLYVLDRDQRKVLVLNSNRMTVLDSIHTSDPTDMAIAPDLRVLAVTNFGSDSVTFIDINPLSPGFHQIIGETRVEPGPTKVAYQPDGEAILVLSPGANALSLLQPDFSVRKVLSGSLSEPIDLAVTERYSLTGNTSQLYYAYLLNRDGTVAIYESGPAGINGLGFDDITGQVPGVRFDGATRIVHDPLAGMSGALVAHRDPRGLGQISRLELTSSPIGPRPTAPTAGGVTLPPTFRQKVWRVTQRYGGGNPSTPVREQLSGNAPVDLAYDEIFNWGAAPDQVSGSLLKSSNPLGHSGKGTVKLNGPPRPALEPKFLFVGLADAGVVDVLEVGSGRRVATVPAPGVQVLGSYWRQ